MPQGKITSVRPFLKNGIQDTWQGKKLFFKSVLTTDSTGEGLIMSENSTPKWAVGMNIEYIIVPPRFDGGLPSYKEIKEVGTDGKKTGGSSYNDPANNKRMAMGMAHNLAIKTVMLLEKKGMAIPYHAEDLKKTFDILSSIAHKYYGWITDDEKIEDRDILSRRWYAIQYGVECIELQDLFNEGKPTDTVILLASFQFEDTMKITTK